MDDLAAGLAGMHEGQASGARGGKQDPTTIVNRLVDAKLVVMEGEAMGIDELPEVKEGLKAAEESIAREMLKEQVLRGVQPDPAEVKRLFEDKVREYQLQSILFPRESDALDMAKLPLDEAPGYERARWPWMGADGSARRLGHTRCCPKVALRV
jgi:hypothetical protein